LNLYRISKKRHATALDGKGSRTIGGRWNHIGTSCIYASENRALSVLELLANTKNEDTPEDMVIITLSIPDGERIFALTELPDNWKDAMVPEETREIGTALLKKPSIWL